MFKNKNKKSLLVIALLVFALVFFATACSSTEEPAAADPVASVTTTEPVVEQVSEEEVLLQAAKNYFDYLPENSNMIKVDPTTSDLVENLDNYYVIDVRGVDDYAKGHIPGSVNIPFKEMGAAIDTLPTDKTIVTVCYTGRTGNQTSAVLKMAGFDAVALRGGHEEWVEAGLPLEQ